MANTDPLEHTIADELNKVCEEIRCARYRHECNDEYSWRLIAHLEDEIDDAIDAYEIAIADLERLYQTVKALL